jgi:hypothetical protein
VRRSGRRFRGATLDKIGEQLPSLGITAASLTLVFFGFLVASWESYDKAAKAVVRPKFRKRAWVAFWGIISSLLAVVLGLVGMATQHAHRWVDFLGLVCLAAWGGLTTYQSVSALRDIK